MDVALVSDYSLDDYKNLGYESKWSTPKGIFDELISTDRVKKVKWYPFPEKLPNYPFVEILNDIEMKNFNPNIVFICLVDQEMIQCLIKVYFLIQS